MKLMQFGREIYLYFTQKKRYHFLFWIAYFFFWLIVSNNWSIDHILINTIYLVYTSSATYFNLYYLMPRLLSRSRILAYGLSLVLTISLFSFLLGISLYAYFGYRNIGDGSFFEMPAFLGPTLGAIATTVLLFMVLKLVKNALAVERMNQKLEKEKLETELKFLRSQLNPHFLFNALNNIYFLIKKNPDKAADRLAQFSNMLRYQLYDCNEPKISLEQEVDYLKNYIEIARLSQNENTELKVNISDQINGEQISPFLLIPFVENAFKYARKNKPGAHFIHIDLKLEHETLLYHIVNSSNMELENTKAAKGIGLENLKRRLTLLYPDKYELLLDNEADQFSIQLKLAL